MTRALRASLSSRRRFDELLGRPVSMRGLALLRVLVGPVVLLHLRPFLSDAWHGRIYRDAFFEPYAAWYPELPARCTSRCSGSRRCRRRHVARLAHAPCDGDDVRDRHLQPVPLDHALPQQPRLPRDRPRGAGGGAVRTRALVDAWIRRRRGPAGARPAAPAWPLWLLRFECAAVYAASGTSKLLDPDWFGGTVPWMRVVQARGTSSAPLPGWAVSILTDRDFYTGAAKLVVADRAVHRVRAVVARDALRGGVGRRRLPRDASRSAAAVEVFSVLGIAVLVIWAVPSTRDRVLVVDPPTRASGAGRVVRRLDWLARFRVEPAAPGWPLESSTATAPRSAARRPGVRAQPPAADGVVRAPGAAAARRPPGSPPT